jgi:hypothetical protein
MEELRALVETVRAEMTRLAKRVDSLEVRVGQGRRGPPPLPEASPSSIDITDMAEMIDSVRPRRPERR